MRSARALAVPAILWLSACSSSNQPEFIAPVSQTPATVGGSNATIPPAPVSAGGSSAVPQTSSASGSPAIKGVAGAATSVVPAVSAANGGAGASAVGAAVAGTGAIVPAGATGMAGTSSAVAGASAVAGTSAAAAGSSAAAGGTGAVSTAGTGAAATAGTGATGASFKRSCIKDGSEVVNIGDSYSNYAIAHTPMATLMTQRAVKDGALKSGDNYLDYAMFGTTLAAPPAEIPNQWDRARGKPPIKVTNMSAGGNDSLINNPQCQRTKSHETADCQKVVADSLAMGKKLWESMREIGVQDVIWFWYPHLLGPGLLNTQGTGNDISDYAFAMLESAAKAASTDSFHVWMVPTIDVFEGHAEYFYVGDNLHANDVGQGKIADKVWGLMKENCIGQAASAGCCAP